VYKLNSGPPQPADWKITQYRGNKTLNVLDTQSSAAEPARPGRNGEAIEGTTDREFELGLWLRGLEAFCSIGRLAFPQNPKHATTHDYKNECRITQAVLLRSSELAFEIERQSSTTFDERAINFASTTIKTLLTLNAALLRSDSLAFDEWQAWSRLAADRIRKTDVYQFFEADFRRSGTSFLPNRLRELLDSERLSVAERRDLAAFLPSFGGILKSLEIVGRMLRDDEPMKPTLAVFAFVYEAANELISDINVRLDRFEDESSELFGMLDAASYTISIEIKKAFSYELSSVIGLRSASSIFARIESAYGVLNDNIQQLCTGFARLAEPGINAIDIFPVFHQKLNQSVELRGRLWEILSIVRELETEPTAKGLAGLRTELKRFLTEPVSFLFYKDRETFERFCTEIAITSEITDAGPVLHRFSAYLETLFGQICIRAVLSNHPFDHK